jgi:hypothetical protein
MPHCFRPMSVLFLFLIITAGCATTRTEKTKAAEIPLDKKTSLSLTRSHEECLEVRYDQIMRYSFSTSKPVDFIIYYQGQDDRIYYADSQKNTSQKRGVLIGSNLRYYAGEQAPYCLQWENPHEENVSMTFEYTIR